MRLLSFYNGNVTACAACVELGMLLGDCPQRKVDGILGIMMLFNKGGLVLLLYLLAYNHHTWDCPIQSPALYELRLEY